MQICRRIRKQSPFRIHFMHVLQNVYNNYFHFVAKQPYEPATEINEIYPSA
jgi:hypothetical protein